MPNHVTNKLVIYSEGQGETEKILDAIKGEFDDGTEMYIDFVKIIPPPENMFVGNLSNENRKQCAIEGRPNWYDWNIKNWGTKWNAYCQSVENDGYGVFTLTFDTAWSPPLPVIVALKGMFPHAEIYGSWLEEGHQSAGVF